MSTSFPTWTAEVTSQEGLGIVSGLTGQKKSGSYCHQTYVDLLTR